MASPTPAVRITPPIAALKDGYQTLITFTGAENLVLWEKSVKPPGLDGGDAIDITTMHNTLLRTMAPRSLQTLSDATFTAAYHPSAYDGLSVLINLETTITVQFPNGMRLAFYGFLKSFEPNEMSEGSQPEATVTVVATNTDPVTGEEEKPIIAVA